MLSASNSPIVGGVRVQLDVGQAEPEGLVVGVQADRPRLAVREALHRPRRPERSTGSKMQSPFSSMSTLDVRLRNVGSPVVVERVELVVADAGAPAAAAEVGRVAGADADVGQVAVRRQRDAEAHDVEVVADRRTGERVVGEGCCRRRCRSRRRSRRRPSRRARRGRSASSRPARRRPTARRRRWCRRRSGCPSCPRRRPSPRSGLRCRPRRPARCRRGSWRRR